jgi:hypothetical protein
MSKRTPHGKQKHGKPNKGDAALKILAEYIAQQLKERRSCLVFEHDLERCWPSSGMSRPERDRTIQDFAQSQGLDCRNSRRWVVYESSISKI